MSRGVTNEDAAPFWFGVCGRLNRVMGMARDTIGGADEGLSLFGDELEAMFLAEARTGRGGTPINTAWRSDPTEEKTRGLGARRATGGVVSLGSL